jgi:hypothetical protein
MEIVASNVRTGETGVDGSVDVDVAVTLEDGTALMGELTLVRDHTGTWSAWGGPDNWVSGALLRDLGEGDVLRERLSEIEYVASLAAAQAE